ncbi:MAG: nicotinate (nicotinamide) nucleotide adenylyltransferase [Solirubrobacterales bacterium]|nr:nicotinate (nicotinamide) nucleotide adenylyltransferase [Solirubrobacterales bacterium]
MARVGILGGTFNPPHVAHLVCAQEARAQLSLDRVILMPVHTPPHKEAPGDPGGETRLELCQAAVRRDEGIEVSRLELDRGGASYTVDTLRALHDADPEDELTFILGGDQAQGLPTWRDPVTILELATLAVAEREGIGREDVRSRLAGLVPPGRVDFFDIPRLDISSSELRRRVAAGRPILHLVPDGVAELIAERRLYALPH